MPLQVETLKMGWCKIGGGEGAKAVADLVMFNTTLRTLDLRGNGFGNDGQSANQLISLQLQALQTGM